MIPFEDIFYNKLSEHDDHHSGSSITHAYASESLHCARQISMRMLNVPEDKGFSLGTLIAFSIGNHLHGKLQQAILESVPGAKDEFVWDMGRVTGRADGVYPDVDGQETILEIKTMADKSFKYAVGYNKKPSADHVMQGAMTGLYLDNERGHIIYISKGAPHNKPSYHEWNVEFDLEAAAKEYTRLSNIAVAADAGIIADRDYNPDVVGDKYPCGFCPFAEKCSKIGDGEIDKVILEYLED